MSPLPRGATASSELSGETRGENMEPSTAALTEDQQAAPAAHSVALTKTYGVGQATVHALAGITVTFERGRFTAVMGPSGSGKSTLMHCMAGLDRPTSGQVFVGGLDIGTLDDAGLTRLRRDRIGFVFQSFNLIPTLTAAENITLPARAGGPQGRPGMVRLPGQGTGHRRPANASSQRAVRRPAAACGVRPGPDQQAGPHLRRRAHRQPGLQRLRGPARRSCATR